MKKQNRNTFALLIVIYLAFISLGLPDGVLGVAWPSIRVSMGMPLESLGILTTLLLILSAVSSVVSGWLLVRLGTGVITFVSGLITALALLGFSFAPSFFWLVLLALPLGFGQGAVDSGLNLYVAEHYSSRHMNWLHCFWGIGASLGPLLMSAYLTQADSGWRAGYRTISWVQFALSAVLMGSLFAGLWRVHGRRAQESKQEEKADVGLSDRNSLLLAVLIFFAYAGVEYSLGGWLGSVLMEGGGIAPTVAGLCVTVYYGSIMAGRFLSGMLVGRLGNMRMVRLGFGVAFAGLVCLWVAQDNLPLLFVGGILCGLGLAPAYPCLMHETPLRFQKQVSDRLIGYQVGAACLGGSILMASTGVLLSRVSLQLLFPLGILFLGTIFVINEILRRRRERL